MAQCPSISTLILPFDGVNDKDGNDDDDKMIESVDRNVSWDPHVLSCRPPCKGQGEEEGGAAGHDDEVDEEYDNMTI